MGTGINSIALALSVIDLCFLEVRLVSSCGCRRQVVFMVLLVSTGSPLLRPSCLFFLLCLLNEFGLGSVTGSGSVKAYVLVVSDSFISSLITVWKGIYSGGDLFLTRLAMSFGFASDARYFPATAF